MKKLLLLLLAANCICYSQSISVGVFEKGYSVENEIVSIYESVYGTGNVTVIYYGNNYNTTLANTLQHDVIIANLFYDATIPKIFADNLAAFYKNNKHIVLSTEGSTLVTGEKFSSYVWNKITGQTITETLGGAYGTEESPRFHPSNGPGGLSENEQLKESTTTYASFGNLNSMNVIHQRTKSEPDCNDVEGLDALYPFTPSLSKGTIYINGEIYYPFYNQQQETIDLATNLAKLHRTILTNNVIKLDSINHWANDKNLHLNFSINKEELEFIIPTVFSPNKDGVNDEFKIKFETYKPNTVDLKIFNRWGNLVYETENKEINWNGDDMIKQVPLSSGTYFYTLNTVFENNCKQNNKDYAFQHKGNITIFK